MASPDDLKQLAPTGTLRVGVVTAPAASAFFAVADGAGELHGVTVDLLCGFAQALELPVDIQRYDNSGQVTEAIAGSLCDLAFMPHDAERAKKVAFGPAYYFIASTYLVPAGSAVQRIEEIDRPGCRIVAISNTTTARSAARTAPRATVREVPSVEEMTELARRGEGDAFALTHDSFAGLLPKLPGARVLPGHFQRTGICVAVPPDRPGTLAIACALVEEAKRAGAVRRAFDAAGFPELEVAP